MKFDEIEVSYDSTTMLFFYQLHVQIPFPPLIYAIACYRIVFIIPIRFPLLRKTIIFSAYVSV